MAIIASNIRRGMAIMFNGEPCRVLDFRIIPPGTSGPWSKRSSGSFRSGVRVGTSIPATNSLEVANMETHELDFMYRSGSTFHFMNAENYDQLEVEEEDLGDNAKWMTDGMRIVAEFYEGRPIGIQLPTTLTFEVVDTAPVMKTATKNACVNRPY